MRGLACMGGYYAHVSDGLSGWKWLGIRAGLKPAPTLVAGPPLNLPLKRGGNWGEGEGWRRFCNGLAPGLRKDVLYGFWIPACAGVCKDGDNGEGWNPVGWTKLGKSEGLRARVHVGHSDSGLVPMDRPAELSDPRRRSVSLAYREQRRPRRDRASIEWQVVARQFENVSKYTVLRNLALPSAAGEVSVSVLVGRDRAPARARHQVSTEGRTPARCPRRRHPGRP